MENEVLQTLKEIRGILYILTVITGISMFVWLVHWARNIFISFKKEWERVFITQAENYFEKADYDKLIEHCGEKLRRYPNHSNAIWWLARVKQETGKELEAKKLFEKLLLLEPSWKENHIDPYIDLSSGLEEEKPKNTH